LLVGGRIAGIQAELSLLLNGGLADRTARSESSQRGSGTATLLFGGGGGGLAAATVAVTTLSG
jgi:hypothetical protein